MAIEESLTTILEREMMKAETSPLEKEATAAEIHIPNLEAEVPEVTTDSPGGEEEIDIQAVQRKELLVIPGD